jgi:ribosomal-protein-alanine N-acetyltransferase
MIVRRALSTEMKAILALEQACAEAPHWSETAWVTALSQDESSGVARVCFVAESGGKVIGFVVVSCIGGAAELESVAVAEAARRQGVGRALCNEAIAWSLGVAAREVGLEVRASSEGALALYETLGFTEIGQRDGYYRDPTDDAVLMSVRLQADYGSTQQDLGGR